MKQSMYIRKEFLKNGKKDIEVRSDWEDEKLAQIWNEYNWEKAKERLFKLQCNLSKVAYSKDLDMIRKMQDKITNSVEAKMLAVKKVSEESKTTAGVDGVRWRSSSEKMRAAISITSKNYKAKPYKHYVFRDEKADKDRQLGIPTMYDRVIQIIFTYALEPVAEAWGDRKSFSARQGRSVYVAHATLCNALADKETGDWILIGDVKSYYDTINHDWLLENIPMNKRVLREFLKSGIKFEDGNVLYNDEGISLGCNMSPLIGNMTLDGLQRELYASQKKRSKKKIDYKNGWCLRFADDVLILARSKEDAEKFKKILADFCEIRGLRLNEDKTEIININKGFEFLSRVYIKTNGILHVIPSERAIRNFENALDKYMQESEKNYSQRKFIMGLNVKLRRLGSIS